MSTAQSADDRAEWLAWRRKGLGGSDVPIILGLTSWGSPGEVWASKTDPDHIGIVSTERMNWGNLLENVVIDEWARRNDIDPGTIRRQVRAEHPDHPWRRCTIDGETDDDPTIVEAKNTSQPPWETPPDAYRCQGIWQMGNRGIHRCRLVTLHQGVELTDVPIEWDADLYEAIAAKAAAFWQLCLDAIHPGDAIEASDTIRAKAAEYERLRQARLAAKAAEEEAQAALRLALEGHPEAHWHGRPLVTDKTSYRTGIDTDALLAAYAQATNQTLDTVTALFQKSTPTRRLNVVAQTLREIAA